MALPQQSRQAAREAGASKGGAASPWPDRDVQHCVGWLMNLSLRLRGGTRTRPSTTPRPGRDRARRTSEIASLPAASTFANSRAVATKCDIRHRRIVICVVFLSPSRHLRRPRSHLSWVPLTYRRFSCDRARNIRDNIRHRRIGPRPTTSVKPYKSYSYDDAGPSSIADDPSPRPPSPESSTEIRAARPGSPTP